MAHIYICVKNCGIIFPKVPQDSNFSHGFLKTVTSPKRYKNQWFLLIISSFLHPCLPFCLTSPKHYKNQWFLLIISSFLHPYLPPFVHSFTPSSLPLLLSVSLPTCLGPKNTQNGRCTYIANFSRSHLPSTSELGFGHAQLGLGHAELGFGHVKLGFTHAEMGFRHAELRLGHAELRFGHEKCQP